MGRVTWPVRVTYLPPLSLGAYKSGESPPWGTIWVLIWTRHGKRTSRGQPARHVETGLRRVGAGC